MLTKGTIENEVTVNMCFLFAVFSHEVLHCSDL